MTEEIKKNMRGFLYPNNKTKPNQPDYTGTLVIDNKEIRLAAWENKSTTDGKMYLSITASEPLTPEQQNKYKQNKDNKPVENNSGGQQDTPSNINDYDFDDDIDKILKASDDENPFN